MAEGQSPGWSDKRKARYLGLNHFDRSSRHDPDKKSKKKSRKIAPSSHDHLILINILLLFGKFALPPSGLSPAFTSPIWFIITAAFQTSHGGCLCSQSLPGTVRGQKFSVCVLGLLCFWMEGLLLRGLGLIFISWYQTNVQKISGALEWNGGSANPLRDSYLCRREMNLWWDNFPANLHFSMMSLFP